MAPLPRAFCLLFALSALACSGSEDTSPDAAGAAPSAGSGGQAPTPPTAGTNQGGSGGQPPAGALAVTPAMFVAENVPLDPIEDGDAIPLTQPPQGGHVLWVGAYVKNLHTKTVELRTRLRDPQTNTLVAEEGRTVVMVPVEGQPDLFQPDIRTVSQVTHVPTCPVYDATPLAEHPYLLEVTVRELYVEPQRSAQGTRQVTPTCTLLPAAGQALCACECDANYVLGKCKDVASPPTN